MSLKSNDAKKVLNFNITTKTKGFTSVTTVDGDTVSEFFLFSKITQIIHHPGVGVEIVVDSGERRVFYNNTVGMSQTIYDTINNAMVSWVNSNLN